jgi:3-hydroxyacyl-CoA dehydrogenase/enoyl-CoA hydratase/3-hydroxybutyryl-CoA epimerase
MSDFIYSKDTDNIVLIQWDVKDKSMNVLTLDGIISLRECVHRALDDETAIGIIIGSGKKDFSGGMDLNILQSMMSKSSSDFSDVAFKTIMGIHELLRKIELAGRNKKTKKQAKPVVWASSGISAGIGTEIALACHYRITTSKPRTRIGLPEILVGLFPFGGGTTRVMRMLGAMAASSVLLEGKMFTASASKSLGLIDEVCEEAELLTKAKAWILSASDAETTKAWDNKGFKVPGGGPYHPSGFLTFAGASALVHAKTQGAYPAHKALLSAAYEGLLVPFEIALKIEARWAVKLLNTPSTFNMIRTLFVNKTALEKGAVKPKDIPLQKNKKIRCTWCWNDGFWHSIRGGIIRHRSCFN